MQTYAFEIEGLAPESAFSAVQDRPFSLFLDSADKAHPGARYSYVLFDPEKTFTFDADSTGDPLQLIQDALGKSMPARKDLPPFQGGLAGLFSYDLGRCFERLPSTAARDTHQPLMAVGLYNRLIAFDHARGKSWIIVRAHTEQEAQKHYHDMLKLIRSGTSAPPHQAATIEFTPQKTAGDYKADIARVIEYIKAGDIFQANLAQRFEADTPEHFASYTHYLKLRTQNPAPYAAYMNLGETVIASASPEQFLHLQDKHVTTRPIKGTSPRFDDVGKDAESRKRLLASAKDKAENIMIVDLLRNDLSKVCTPESVDVPTLCALESFAGVHHLVSTVAGTLKDECNAFDLLRACFPGGSITGAPKIRAMEIIDELEPSRRGAYCGSVGYIGYDGAMDTNILIRTLVYHNGKVYLQSGGGITASSDPNAEYQETLDKAARIFDSYKTPALKKAS